jgi:hypothetical protein
MTDMPDELICAYGQLESPWPVSGSVLVHGETVYFAAGRNTHLDGGIHLYAVKLATGELVNRKPMDGNMDVLVLEDDVLHMRHAAAKLDLKKANAVPHLLPTAGFLDGMPQHRTYWTIGTTRYARTSKTHPSGDILVKRGKEFYEVQGFPVHRHSYFDPRVEGYVLHAGTTGASDAGAAPAGQKGKKGRRKGGRGESGGGRAAARWRVRVPCTGMAMALAGDKVIVAGMPSYFPPDHPFEKYAAAYRGELGGILVMLSAAGGKKTAEVKLDAAPAWDGMAVANGCVYVALQDGSICCLAAGQE